MYMAKHLIVVSVDAMVFEDLEYCRTLPNFKRVLDGASVIKRVKTIYPSVTHPAHATIMSGNPAGVTGIVNNIIFNPNSPDKDGGVWYNRLEEVKCETIFHAAKRAGLSTAAASWPMTSGGQEVIDYLVPCALDIDFQGVEDNHVDVYRRLGAQECVIPIIEEAARLFTYDVHHPAVEEFQAYCSKEIIKKFKPNLLLTHPAYVDNQRHAGGVFGDKVNHALEETDRWIGMLLDAVRDAGIEEETDFVILSDHGQINITRTISPNVYLADKGYIDIDEKGDVSSWRAFSQSTGASAHIYLNEPDNEKLEQEVYELLSDMADEGIYGFERVYTKDEVKEKYNLYGDFSFVLETDGYTSFGEWVCRPSVRGYDASDYRYGRGTHGHEPHKGPQPTFIAKGPSFKEDCVIENGCMLNHAPTLARALGISLTEAMGKPVYEILK